MSDWSQHAMRRRLASLTASQKEPLELEMEPAQRLSLPARRPGVLSLRERMSHNRSSTSQPIGTTASVAAPQTSAAVGASGDSRSFGAALPTAIGAESATCGANLLATAPISGPCMSAVPEVSIPAHDLQAMGWRRKYQGLLTESKEEAGEVEPAAPVEPVAPAIPKGLLGDLGPSPIRRVVSARSKFDEDDDDLFSSPPKATAEAKPSGDEAKPWRRARQKRTAAKLAEHEDGQALVDGLVEHADRKPRKRIKAEASQGGNRRQAEIEEDPADEADQVEAAVGAVVAAPEFRARPNLANAAEDGPDEALELVGETDNPLRLSVPASINQYLREYQRAGVRFFFRQYARGVGGILADDMGLGKTIQTIAFCAAILGKTGTDADAFPQEHIAGVKRWPILILAPSSVLTNWEREFNTWGAFRTCIYHGKGKGASLQGIAQGTKEIMLTSYDLYRMDYKDILQVKWHAVWADEAHKLKNDESQIYRTSMLLNTKLRYGLTGTVMQNRFVELYCILDWAAPGSLGDRSSFNEHYADPLRRGQQKDANEWILARARERQEDLKKLLERYLLRRTKDNTIKDQLPSKTDNIVFCELSELQLKAYRRVLRSPDFQLLCRAEEKCTCGSGLDRVKCCYLIADESQGGVLWPHYHKCDCPHAYDPVSNPNGCKWHKPDGCPGPRLKCPNCLILPCLTILQKISNHLELIKVDPEECRHDERKKERQMEVAEMVLGEDAAEVNGLLQDKSFLYISDSRGCGKLNALEKLLALWSQAPGNKVLLFSHSVKMLRIIEQIVIRAGYNYTYLDGQTKREERQKEVDRFNSDPSLFVFMISTMAGGLGLNLTSANKVVIVDPSWNPSHDLQAQDRAFRIGQRRDVAVYRLISTGTVEEIVYTRQIYKQQQSAVAVEASKERRYFDAIQQEPGSKASEKGELFGVRNLFRLTEDRVATKDIVDRQSEQEQGFRIEEYDAQGALDIGGGSGGDLALDPGVAVEDAGLGDLARHIAGEDLATPPRQPARSAQRNRRSAGDGEVAGEDDIAMTDAEAERQQLEEAGMLHVHHHDKLLGGSRKEEAVSQKAQRKLAMAARLSTMADREAVREGIMLQAPPASDTRTRGPTIGACADDRQGTRAQYAGAEGHVAAQGVQRATLEVNDDVELVDVPEEVIAKDREEDGGRSCAGPSDMREASRADQPTLIYEPAVGYGGAVSLGAATGERRATAIAGMAGSSVPKMSVLQSLAHHRRILEQEMAHLLLSLSDEERLRLMQEYAADPANSVESIFGA